MPANHPEPVKNQTDIPEDEIELIDLLRVIWKWKYLIIIGTAVCALAAVIISFNLQPIYQVSMVLKSGIYKVGVDGKPVFSDSVEEFKSIIEDELIYKVSEYRKNNNKAMESSTRDYKVTADNKKNILRIFSESTDREEGIENFNYLTNMLSERYENRLTYLKDEYVYELMAAKRQLEFSVDEERFITLKLIDIQKKTDGYMQEIDQSHNSSESEAKSQNTLLDYASIVEKIADLKRRQSQVNSAISYYKKKMADLENEKPSKQAIIVAKPPTASQHPIKPNKRRNVMLATIAGLFMMVFLSFFTEYITQNRKKIFFKKAGD